MRVEDEISRYAADDNAEREAAHRSRKSEGRKTREVPCRFHGDDIGRTRGNAGERFWRAATASPAANKPLQLRFAVFEHLLLSYHRRPVAMYAARIEIDFLPRQRGEVPATALGRRSMAEENRFDGLTTREREAQLEVSRCRCEEGGTEATR